MKRRKCTGWTRGLSDCPCAISGITIMAEPPGRKGISCRRGPPHNSRSGRRCHPGETGRHGRSRGGFRIPPDPCGIPGREVQDTRGCWQPSLPGRPPREDNGREDGPQPTDLRILSWTYARKEAETTLQAGRESRMTPSAPGCSVSGFGATRSGCSKVLKA